MVDEVPTYERAADVQKGQVHICAPFIADAQTAIAIEPGERAFNHPPMPAKSLTRLDAAPRNTWRDAALAQLLAQWLRVICFIGVQLRGPLTWSPAPSLDRLNGIQRFQHHARVMHIGCAYRDRKRDALSLSTTTWRFVPDLPRSVGFAPVWPPPFLRARLKSPEKLATSQCGRPRLTGRAAGGGVSARLQPRATRAACASRSS